MRLSLSAFPISVQQVTVPAIVLIISLVAFIFDSSLSGFFVYQRSLVTQGEVWRVFSGHFFHTNGAHFLLNSAAVIMLWALHGHFYTIKSYLIVFMISAVICAAGIHWFSPNIEQYVGLSGILHGLFIWGAIEDIKAKERTGYLLLIGVILKIAHEQYYGASEDVADLIGANVAINAHLWGALGGVLAILFLMAIKSFSLKKTLR
ncbi:MULTISPECIES: rhombosortase [unclassified Colwellia]|uniref:rhombosortase n=1 Tax=unclassified Colwellia TaxID=196834 RepID=UPI0015F6A988|nr:MULTISPECIES: rhombosortase [unclassified Colwellia]MBA6373421.1 rhombosortase [Colwellia sp. BRX8-4]MBA6381067.1 rhombosortase [Colwellia sp. BRX10-7]MBA6388883.1 rhombosortase [Colwellia sp. BRX10-2]MBA6403554.1 rhombosortase [Colwellia sp. BRX10-5]MBA6407504.1 rhombosortase [Colwellia sp. BRX10-1]